MIGIQWHLIPAEFVVNVKRAWTFVSALIKKDIIMKKMKKVFKKDKALFKKAKKIKRSNEKKEGKIEKVMKEFKSGSLHSGSKKGPEVKSKKQAIAIALSEARKAGEKVPKKPMKKKK